MSFVKIKKLMHVSETDDYYMFLSFIRYNAYNLHDTLARCHIQLNRKVLANMAIWEPRTFRSIAAIAAFKENQPYSEGGYQANQPGPGIDVHTDGKL